MPHLKERISIIDFCEDPQLLNLAILDTQKVLLKISYGLKLTSKEKRLYYDMTNGEDPPYKPGGFSESVYLLGRGSGKSLIAAAAASYEACCTQWSDFLRKGELAWIFVVATREKQAIDIGRNMIFSLIEASPMLSKLIVTDVDDQLKKSFPRTSTDVLILSTGAAVIALPCSARVGRGYPTAGFILDEFAWYAKESKRDATDAGIYDSLIPRTLQFREHSKMFLISSPGEKDGLAWTRWNNRKKHKDLYFCCKIPTSKMRPDYSKSKLDEIAAKSPLGAERELNAEFLSSRQPLMARDLVIACVREEEALTAIPFDAKHAYEMAIDQAFGEQDRFAFSVGHIEMEPSGKYKVIIDLTEIISGEGEVDFVEKCADRVAIVYKQYDLLQVYCDQYQVEAFSQILDKKGVNVELSRWNTGTHRLKYGRLKNFMRRRLVSLPNNQDLIDEISELELRFLPSIGQYTVTHKPNGHDDGADTVAEVVFRLTDDLMNEAGIYTDEGKDVKV